MWKGRAGDRARDSGRPAACDRRRPNRTERVQSDERRAMKSETVDGVKSPARRDEEPTGFRAPLGWWNRGREFLVEVRNELKRVTWPSRKEVYATTLVVILT